MKKDVGMRTEKRLYIIEEKHEGKWSFFSQPAGDHLELEPTAYLTMCREKFPEAKLRITFTTKN